MNVLVAYATRHGATQGIAERIAQTLERHGLQVTLQSADQAGALEQYDAFVVGSAAYMGAWLEPARHIIEQHRALLASRPVWLFSSGPVGSELIDANGRDVVEASVPREFARFASEIQPRDERVFFGAYDPEAEPVGLMERMGSFFTRMPAIREALPAGDFRDWPAIESWAEAIAGELTGRGLAASNSSPIARTT
jgi:menaquinone-dependent protoporphyrinogen oxidase